MTGLRLSENPADLGPGDLLVVPVFADGTADGQNGTAAPVWPPAKTLALATLRRDKRFAGEVGQVSPILAVGADGPDILAVGVGNASDLGLDALRTAAQAAAQATFGRKRIGITLAQLGRDRSGAVRAVAEGIMLGRYQAPRAVPRDEDLREDILLLEAGESSGIAIRRAFEIGQVSARTANWVRRLVDLPPRELPPAVFARTLADKARELGVDVEIWDRETMLARGFGGTAAVGGGSIEAPQVVVLRTPVRAGRRPLGLAGKGITFDSGGINLKRNLAEIFQMKTDMAGAAAVAGAIFAAIELGAEPDIVAVLPMAENMPSGTALRPGDVITHPNGMKTEVVDTDCEGRLILADAVAFLAESGVGGIVDIGTLTDGGGVGPLLWGCWASDDALAAGLLAAGDIAGEPGWRLPLRREYRGILTSRVADIANTSLSSPDIGLTAATYLRAFAGTTPWVHVDNGSSAYLEHEISAWPCGPTGSPMRAVLQLLLERA